MSKKKDSDKSEKKVGRDSGNGKFSPKKETTKTPKTTEREQRNKGGGTDLTGPRKK